MQASHLSVEERAQRRAHYTTGLVWHAGSFCILNTFLWILDAMGPRGIDWAYWITLVWLIALAFHVLAWLVTGRGLEDRLARDYIEKIRKN